MKIFVDESGQIKGRYSHFMVGVLYVYEIRKLEKIIEDIRKKHKFKNEMHFHKISTWRFKVYKEILDKALSSDAFWVSVLDLPRDRLDIKHFSGQQHIAYNFYVKRALQHSIIWGLKEDAYIYFDKKSRTREDNFRSKNSPYKIINQFEHIDSKRSDLLQFLDLIVGAIHHFREGKFKSVKKKKLAELVMDKQRNTEIYRWGDNLFNEAG